MWARPALALAVGALLPVATWAWARSLDPRDLVFEAFPDPFMIAFSAGSFALLGVLALVTGLVRRLPPILAAGTLAAGALGLTAISVHMQIG
jgi:uncharacterized membrane protein YphA (DoxX/SURF4 family)